MIRTIIFLMLLPIVAVAQTRTGPMQVQNGLAEIAAGGTAAQAAARANVGAARADAKLLDAKEKGLVCDGATDNAAAITTINAATAGATIYLPPAASPCLTSVALSPAAGVTVWAYAGTVTLKPTAGSTANPVLISVANRSNVLISGLVIDGGGRDFGTANNVATVFQADNVIFDRVTVQHTRGLGIVFSTAVSNSGVRNSKLSDVGNHWITTGLTADQKQGIAFCCGFNLTTSATQGGASATLTFAATTGVVDGMMASGTLIPAGSYVISHTSTTVVLSVATTGAMNSGTAVAFSNNFGNFVVNSTFDTVGIDAISIANQTSFVASNNIFKNVGGAIQAGIAGGAAIYASNNSSILITGNDVNTTFGNGIDVINTPLATISGNKVLSAAGAGISYASGSNSSITGNVTCNNNQSHGGSSLNAGISLSVAVSETTIVGNTACDTQGSPTQASGIQQLSGGTYTNIWVDQSNTVAGSIAPFGGSLSAYTPFKISSTVNGLTQLGVAPNQPLALLPTGTGYVSLSVPDGTTTGGNTPGNNALSLSIVRSSAGHMASAPNSILLGGSNNLASGQYGGTIGGEWNIANGPGSYALGQFGSTEFRVNSIVHAGGEFTAQGDAQAVYGVFHRQSTSATPVVLTSDGNAPGTQNIANVGITSISTKRALRGRIQVIARSTADIKEWACDYLQNSGSGAATVVLIGSSCTSAFASAGASAWTFSLVNDNVNGGISQTATGAAGTTIDWVSQYTGVETGGL